MGDPYSGMYAADILKTFLDSGWTVDKKEFSLEEFGQEFRFFKQMILPHYILLML